MATNKTKKKSPKPSYKIITWNCEGAQSKKQEVDILISDENPLAICLQDTRLTEETEKFLEFNGYKSYFKSIRSTASGVALYVKKTVPQSPVILNTNLQAVAVRVTMKGKSYVLTSVYVPPSSVPTVSEFDSFITSLKSSSYILNGDLNAHSPYWGSRTTCPRGKVVEPIIEKHHLIPINTQDDTFFSRAHESYSLIDLTLAHPSIFLDFQYKVLPDSHNSDHYPIVLDLNGDCDEGERIPHWNFKKADWDNFARQASQQITESIFLDCEDKMEAFTEALIDIATANIPKTSRVQTQVSKSWFDDECKAAKRERNRVERLYKAYPDLSNRIKVKKMQAETRRLFRSKKRKSFRSYVSSLGEKVKAKKMWAMIRKMTGKKVPGHLHHMKDSDGNLITNKEELSNLIGKTYEDIHSSSNYSKDFENTKKKEEEKTFDFNDGSKHRYNRKFRLRDLRRSIKKAKDTAAGPDQVHYQILKHLPEQVLQILLDILNEYWENQTFPPGWRLAMVLPIPKPGKDLLYPTSYRPIALTSCLCKTMERMVNERLVHHLERNRILTKFQCGFRNDMSTTDQLVRLDTYIRDALIDNDHAVAVFFDLHKAYDTTWKHGILRDLYDKGLRGNLPMFIKNFLTCRHFMVLYGATLSDTFVQEEGVPQGAILSTTLFNIKLNDIVKVIMPGVECSLYVDDFVIMFKAKRMTCLSRKLKESIAAIEKWTRDNGFTIAVGDDKTVAMHFCRHRSCENPDLVINGQQIRFVKEKKFLGLIWDTKLNFKAHIKYLKQKCQNSLNIIKILSHTDWGAGKKVLLKLYRALVRSKLDYGCIIYRNASETDLKTLDVVHNQGIRLCLGAFKSSPIESLYVEANEPPLRERRLELMMKYGLRIKCNTRNPAYKAVFDMKYKNKYNAPVTNARRNSVRPRRRARSLAVELDELFRDSGINTPECNLLAKVQVNKVFDYPPCYSRDVFVNFDLLAFDKSSTTDAAYKVLFGELVERRYKKHIHYFTDGSKKDEISSYGGFCPEYLGVFSRRICNHSSIYTAEAQGMIHALKHIKVSPSLNGKFVIFSDSKSVLESIQTQNSKNITLKEINEIIQQILNKSRKTLEFCWVPSHRGIEGNVKADKAAERARERERDDQFEIPYTDLVD